MLRIREIKPTYRFEGDKQVKTYDVELVHDYEYGDVTIRVKVSDKPDDETILNLALEIAYGECLALSKIPVPYVTIAPLLEEGETPPTTESPSSD